MPAPPDDHLVGFDVRLICRGPPPLLQDPAVRTRHLPRTDLKALVSFDRLLCPQRFVHRERLLPGQPVTPDSIIVEPGENIGFDLFWLWDDLYDMAARHGQQGIPDCGLAWAILDLSAAGITPPTDAMYGELAGMPTHPALIGSDWPLLGFDIVNLYFQSFLASFDLAVALTPPERQALATLVNPFGLLADRPACPRVVQMANQHIADHGPFFALSVWLLWDRTGMLAGEKRR